MIKAKKNAAFYLSFPAIDSANPESYKSGLTITDTAYYKDGAGVWTSLAITDTVTEIGTTGIYEIDLTAAELNHDRVIIKFTATGMADDAYQFDLQAKIVTDLQDLTAAQVNAEVDTALADYDGPTNAELNARTLLAADYFNSATDTVTLAAATHTGAVIPTVSTVSNAVTLPSIPANWITAAGIAAGALDGKGNWNIGKTGYTLTQAFPANFAALGISVGGAINDVTTVATLTGHTPQTADHAANIAAILTDTSTTLDTKLNNIQGATFNTATDSLEAIRNRGDAAWTTGAGGTPPQLLQSTTIATLASQTSFTLTAGSSDDNAYNGAVIVITDSATSVQKAVGEVSAYTGATKSVTLTADPAIFTMAVGDTVEIIAALGAAGSGASAADVWSYATRVLTAGTNLNDIAASDIVTGGPIATTGGAINDVTTVATLTGHTPQTADHTANIAAIDGKLNDIQGATFNTATDSLEAIRNTLEGSGIKKNAAFNNFPFEMVLASDGKTPATGLTVTGQRSLDGGAYVAVSGTITEISNGAYQFDATAADTNGDTVKWKFSAATADDTKVEFITT